MLALDIGAARGAALLAECGRADTPEKAVRFVDCDLADLAATKARVEALCRQENGVDILINNAAIYPSHSMEDYSIEQLEAIQRVNVQAAIVASQAVIPAMKRRGFGPHRQCRQRHPEWRLGEPLALCRLEGRAGRPDASVGARTWAGWHYRQSPCPGAFPTDAEKIHADPEGYARFVIDRQSIKRRGTPEDIADVMMFLTSDAASFVTGQTINVDGGWIMS